MESENINSQKKIKASSTKKTDKPKIKAISTKKTDKAKIVDQYFNSKEVKKLVENELSNISIDNTSGPIIQNEPIFNSNNARSKRGKGYHSIKTESSLDNFIDKETAKKASFENKEELKRSSLIETNTIISNLPKFTPYKTQIYPMSAEEIREKSVVNITSTNKLHDLSHGLFDLSMGSVKNREICITCGRDDRNCRGHFGHIELPTPIVNPIFEKDTINSLRCICSYCGDTFINKKFYDAFNLKNVPKKKLLKVTAEISEKWLYRLHRHDVQKTIYEPKFKGSRLLFSYEGKDTTKKVRTVESIIKIFSSVSQDKLKLIGFEAGTHPLNFISKCIVCCPPHIRPPSVVNGKIVDHPLTTRYIEVLNSIIKLQRYDNNTVDKDTEFNNLYTSIKEIAFGPEKKTGVKLSLKESGIFQGLTSKKGIIRGNIMGKRVDNCGRTVGGPGFELNIGEVMIPESSAKKILLVPVTVHKYNLALVIKEYHKRVYKFMIMPLLSNKGFFPITESHLKEYVPQIGDTFLRHVKDGDRTLAGRQPSLHAESILGYTIKLNKWDTIKIHSSNNHCFNADFDGDEFSYYILQDILAMAESDTVMNFKYHIMNVQSNRPMMALAFHGLIGSFLMTVSWEIFNKPSKLMSKEWIESGIPNSNGNIPGNINLGTKYQAVIPEKRWHEALSIINDSYRKSTLETRLAKHGINNRSGRALFSLALPTNFTYSGNGIEIIDGILIKGVLKKANIGLKVMSLVQVLAKMYSIKEACRFINDGQKIADWFSMWHNLSIGYKDFDANRSEVVKELKKDLNKMQIEYFNLGPKPKDEINLFFWTRALHGIVDKTKINGRKIGEKFLAINNTLNILSEDKGCGVKGSLVNTGQIIGSLGEQFIGSNFPTYDLKNGTRCLPYYPPNDVSLESIGYIINSYMDGINPSSSFFHEMASRISLIDTARNVSEIGYTHRRIEKSLEPIRVDWLGFITATDGRMFQPFFGNGFSVSKVMPIKTKRLGEKIFFCDFSDEAKLLCKIYENKNNIVRKKKKVLNEYETFKLSNGRYPKFSELV